MSSFNLFNNHPIIPNANQYFYEKKYVSINSEDRDILRYPNSSEFEIELPQDYLNVASVSLTTWQFPCNYNVFSVYNYNVTLVFKMVKLYNPGEFGIIDPLLQAIFEALYANITKDYIIIIEIGFYNPEQMQYELTNKMNEIVTATIDDYFSSNPKYNDIKDKFKTYDRFKVVYNTVNQNMWFGNEADQFVLQNDSPIYSQSGISNLGCLRGNNLPQAINWGLPSNLGFSRCPVTAISSSEALKLINEASTINDGNISFISQNYQQVPRFYYGDILNAGDNGYWIVPKLPHAEVYFLQAPAKINFMGPAYMFMEIDGLNCIDETSPYNLSGFTVHTNETNGVVNSCFAKIPIPALPVSQWFDTGSFPYKYFNPPAERIRKLKIKIRYHNGQLVDFGTAEYSFLLSFNLLTPQQERSYSIRDANNLNQIQILNDQNL
jgi:hypothetical protein